MYKDLESHKISLRYEPNKHILFLGKSGTGKSYAATREIQQRVKEGNRVIILDVAASYTRNELKKSGNVLGTDFAYLQMDQDQISFPVWSDDPAKAVSDAISEAFEICSYIQKKILNQICTEMFDKIGVFNFMDLHEKLEAGYSRYQSGTSDESSDTGRNFGLLLNRLYPLEGIGNISLCPGECLYGEKEKPVTVMQLSDFSVLQKRRLSSFFLSVIWANAQYRGKHEGVAGFDVVVLDEFQHLSLSESGSFNAVLREGRKFDFSAILCTQFLEGYGQNELGSLTQVGTVLLFRPTESGVKQTLDLFELGDRRKWRNILLNLKIGQAVLVGAYAIEGGRKCNTPIIVAVADDGETVDDRKSASKEKMAEKTDEIIGEEGIGQDDAIIVPEIVILETDQVTMDETEEKNEAHEKKRGRGTVSFR